MNKNIRRSIVIAAGVTGAWALGSTVASADELPASTLSVPDNATDVTDATDSADAPSLLGGVTDTVDGVVSGVTDTVTGVTEGATGEAADTARTTPANTADQARRYVDADLTAPSAADRTTQATKAKAKGAAQVIQGAKAARADKATAHATAHAEAHVSAAVTDVRDHLPHNTPQHPGTIDYLFGPLAAFAPELEQALAAAQTKVQGVQAAARSQAQGVEGVVRTKAQYAVTGAGRTAAGVDDVTHAAAA
ncbi:hypothetical protein ABZ879_06170, partial [Streptomyces chartreusis]